MFLNFRVRLLILYAGLLTSFVSVAALTPPNIVLIHVDDVGYGEWGLSSDVHPSLTPLGDLVNDFDNYLSVTGHIDRLAKDGVRFTNGYASSPVCWPTRGSLMTGRHHIRWGSYPEFSASEKTIAHYLKELGYTSALLGKWHSGDSFPFRPTDRGFDYFFGFLAGAHSMHDFTLGYLNGNYVDGITGAPWWRVTKAQADADGIDDSYAPSRQVLGPTFAYTADIQIKNGVVLRQHDTYTTLDINREAVQFIDQHQNEPFFLYVSHQAVHVPSDYVIEDFNTLFPDGISGKGLGRHAAMLKTVDHGVGDIVAKLKELGLFENTMLIFVSDNGGTVPTQLNPNQPDAGYGSNGRLRETKQDWWEGGIRVPFMIHWPEGGIGQSNGFGIQDWMAKDTDLLPTVLAAVGLDIPDKLDGVNLLPFLRGEVQGEPHNILYWASFGQKFFAVRRRHIKLVSGGTDRDDKVFEYPNYELFDLSNDIQVNPTDPLYEAPSLNLARDANYASTVADLDQLYKDWLDRTSRDKSEQAVISTRGWDRFMYPYEHGFDVGPLFTNVTHAVAPSTLLGASGAMVGQVNIPDTGFADIESVLTRSIRLRNGVSNVVVRARAGLAAAPQGRVRFNIHLRFSDADDADLGWVAATETLALDEGASDVMSRYFSPLAVPNAASAITAIRLRFMQDTAGFGTQIGYVDKAQILFLPFPDALYRVWKIRQGIPSTRLDTADGDQDGVPLLLEYALRMNPLLSDRGALVDFTINGNHMQLLYAHSCAETHKVLAASEFLTLQRSTPRADAQGAAQCEVATALPVTLAEQFTSLALTGAVPQ